MEEKRFLKRKEKALNDGNREQLAISCNNLGDFYNEQGKYLNAVKEYLQEAELYEKLGKRLEMAKAHRMVGEMCMLLCEFEKAKKHINTYLTTVKKLEHKVEEQRAYATLGRAHLLHGQSSSESSACTALQQLKQAEKAFLRSLLLTKELTGHISKLEQLDMQARCYLNMGVVKEHIGEFVESIAYIEKAIQISKTHDIYELTHLCYISMSLQYHSKKNDATLALRYCNLALEVAKRLPSKVKKICETLITKSEILIKVGDFASAKQILTKAYKKNSPDENDRATIEKTLRVVVKICQTLNELVTVSSIDYAKRKCLYEKLGDGCCNLSNYSKALEYYQQMLECAQRNGESGKSLIPIYVSLYQTYKDNKQYDKALEYLWQELEQNKDVPKEAFTTLCEIADVCEQQMQPFWTIQDIYQKAKVHSAKAGDAQHKLEKIVYARLKKLQLKHKMNMLYEELVQEAKTKGIDLENIESESDTESEEAVDDTEQNTPELGDDVCLDELTDSDTSDLDESDKLRSQRSTRGTRCLTIKRNNKGETQLHQACIHGNLELVRRLLDQGHVVNVRDHAGWLPLHESCNHGFREIAELLLDRGAAVAINDKGGTSCDGITPLYDACSNGFLDVVELLLERGADVTVRTDFGETCVNGLDKWRRSANLTAGEQAQYEQVRAVLSRSLSKVGMKYTAPLTNANVEVKQHFNVDCEDLDNDLCDTENLLSHANSGKHSELNISSGSNRTRKSSPRQTAASVQYKHAIEQLKRPNRIQTISDNAGYTALPSSSHSSSSNLIKQKRNALLDVDEVDDDDWLIDDLGPEKKKRRYYTTPPQERKLSTLFNDNMHDSEIHSSNLEPNAEKTDAFQLLGDAWTNTKVQLQKQSPKLIFSRTSSIGSCHASCTPLEKQQQLQNKRKHQASLLDSGFCRFRSESPNLSDDSNSTSVRMRATEPDSTTSSIQLLISPAKSSPLKVQATPLLTTTVSFKVKVEQELLLVPIERKKMHDINMRWLAEEAARRYYNLVGLKPVLRLKTADGFAYEESDAVVVALEQNIIVASVLEWTILPLSQRYEEMCRLLNSPCNTDVHKVLERSQVTNDIQFDDYWLTAQQTEPIFKALLQQSNLRVLDLSNNFIQNEGCRQLAKSLPTLKQLKVLNLKGNFIGFAGLELLLTTSTDNEQPLSQLEELNLCQNPLGNESVRLLDQYCNSVAAKSLQKLLIAQCELTNLYDFDLCYFQLYHFDISYNQLVTEALCKLLAKLNACRIQHLNLSYTFSTTNNDERCIIANAERIVEFFESGTCEQFKSVALCGCQLSDSNVYRLVQCLHNAKNIELLDLSDNVNLSITSLQFIIEKIPQIRKLNAINCHKFIDNERTQQLEQLKHIPNLMSFTSAADAPKHRLITLWQTHWADKAKVLAFASQLRLYINDKDLLL